MAAESNCNKLMLCAAYVLIIIMEYMGSFKAAKTIKLKGLAVEAEFAQKLRQSRGVLSDPSPTLCILLHVKYLPPYAKHRFVSNHVQGLLHEVHLNTRLHNILMLHAKKKKSEFLR